MDLEHLGIQEGLQYFHPFSNECRVYGRLKEFNKEHIAVRCYGYVFLTPDQSWELLADKKFDRKRDWGWGKKYEGKDIRLPALVKEYVPTIISYDPPDRDYYPSFRKAPNPEWKEVVQTHFADAKSGVQFLHNVIELHHMGITINDLHGGNIIYGKIFDFSCAWTAPHPCFEPEWLEKNPNHWYFKWTHRGLRDAWDADKIVHQWNELPGNPERIWHRLTPNREYCQKLRSETNKKEPQTQEERRAMSKAFRERYSRFGGQPLLFKLKGRQPNKNSIQSPSHDAKKRKRARATTVAKPRSHKSAS